MTGLETRFTILLVALVSTIVVVPLAAEAGYGAFATSSVFAAVLLAGAFVVGERHSVRWPSAGLVLSVVVLEVLVHTLHERHLFVAAQLLTLAFLGFATWMIFLRVVREDEVTADTVMGGAAVYLLAGVFFYSLHSLVELFFHGAYLQYGEPLAQVSIGRYPTLIYFSFATLTTLGYGDVSPAHPLAESLSAMEAVTGQLLLAILIARLVGLHVHGSRR